MDWIECCDKKFVKTVSIDVAMINSLTKSSEKKMLSARRLELDDITASSVVVLFYDALRELLEALSLKKGFKIYNHECFYSFLKEIMKEDSLGEKFDRARRMRNRNYYGEEISVTDAKEIIENIQWMIDKVKKI